MNILNYYLNLKNNYKNDKIKKLTLYPEDFEKTHIWKDICDCLGISYNSPEVHIEFINVKTYEDD